MMFSVCSLASPVAHLLHDRQRLLQGIQCLRITFLATIDRADVGQRCALAEPVAYLPSDGQCLLVGLQRLVVALLA